MTQAIASPAVHDLIGIGFGPSNLALAIALQEREKAQGKLDVLFLDKQADYRWHGNTLVTQSELQISFLKDLVSLRNPTSPYSFVNYLHQKKRLADFINLGTFYPCRMEYNDYLRWAAEHFADQAVYGEEVLRIEPELHAGRVEHLRRQDRENLVDEILAERGAQLFGVSLTLGFELDRFGAVGAAAVRQGHRLGQRRLEAHRLAVGGQQGPGGRPLEDADVTVQDHRRAGQDVEVVAAEMQVANAQPIELQEVFAHQRAFVVQRREAQIVGADLDLDFEQRRPAPQHRAAQAQQQPAAIDRQALDVKPVVLAGDGHVGPEVGVLLQGLGEQVALRVALEASGASAVSVAIS